MKPGRSTHEKKMNKFMVKYYSIKAGNSSPELLREVEKLIKDLNLKVNLAALSP